MEQAFEHIPVMRTEVEGTLGLKPGCVVVDATLGLGGHSSFIAEAIGPKGHLIGLDQDERAIAIAKERLKGFGGRLDIVRTNFSRLDAALDGLGVKEVDAFLFDVGVSSMQLDDSSRGFSFREDGPLDMRMDLSSPTTAAHLIHDLPEEELADIFWKYGEERFSRRVARLIVQTRAIENIDTTGKLAALVLKVVPRNYDGKRMHPATRVFQGLRIALNAELDVLSEGVSKAFSYLKISGRMTVISFHSLEDRIVKEKFRSLAGEGLATLLTKKPLRPSDGEAEANPRARSARLRALERLA